MRAFACFGFFLWLGASSSARAADDAPTLPDMTDLFGDTLAPSTDMKELEEATANIPVKRETGLSVKSEVTAPDVSVHLLEAFAAAKIVNAPKEGCIPADALRTIVKKVELDRFPGQSTPFSVCMKLRSRAHRAMQVAAFIVDARQRRVAKLSDRIDFTSHEHIDFILDFPAVPFRMEGPHELVVETEGKEAGRAPLLTVTLAP